MKQYGIDASKPNMKIITHIDVDKAIDIVARAKAGLMNE
jgi:hypothetical protein